MSSRSILFFGCVLSTISSYAMDQVVVYTALQQLAATVANCPLPVASSSDIKPIALPLRTLAARYCDQELRDKTLKELAPCKRAAPDLQKLWHDAQTKIGIAKDRQADLFVDTSSSNMFEEFSTNYGKTRINPIIAATFERPLPPGCPLDLQGYLRTNLLHEAGHILLANVEQMQYRIVENICAYLNDREILLIFFAETLDSNWLPTKLQRAGFVAPTIELLKRVPSSTRISILLQIFSARVHDFESFKHKLAKQCEREADEVMLKYITCEQCLYAVVRNTEAVGLDTMRTEAGYAPLATLKAKLCELKGKCCEWHKKYG